MLAFAAPVERTRRARPAVAIWCGAAIAASEIAAAAFGAIPSAIFDAGLACLLLVLFVCRPTAESSRPLPVLALVALIRPISLAAAVPALGSPASYVVVGLPLLVGAVLATRVVPEPRLELHLRVERPPLDGVMGAAGVVAGLLGYVLLRPAPLLAHANALGYAATAVILVIFGGLLEELIFRGLVQNAVAQVLGGKREGVWYAAALSVALYMGSGSIPYALFMGVVGCMFGLALLRGASLWGIALGHGLMLVTIAFLAQVPA